MKARIWGCRGSVASPGPDTVRYGGNTSCVEVRGSDGTAIVLDAGTGMRPLGAQLRDEGVTEIHVLLSHLHLDHLQGLGFFKPLFDPDVHVHLWGPASPVSPLADRIALYLSPPLFPVRLSEIPCQLTFHDAPEDPVQIGGIEVVAGGVTHQGPTVGYRLTEDGRSLCYLPDHEPSLGVRIQELEPEWISGYALAHGVDYLIHDAQYGDGEYPDHIGWGHSSVEHVVAFAKKAEVGTLVLFHHDPYHDDDHLDALRVTAAELLGQGPDAVSMAYEGMELAIGTSAGSVSSAASTN
jgi:phosphoribosyl 1,2-cyclic phosphodiesterase